MDIDIHKDIDVGLRDDDGWPLNSRGEAILPPYHGNRVFSPFAQVEYIVKELQRMLIE